MRYVRNDLLTQIIHTPKRPAQLPDGLRKLSDLILSYQIRFCSQVTLCQFIYRSLDDVDWLCKAPGKQRRQHGGDKT